MDNTSDLFSEVDKTNLSEGPTLIDKMDAGRSKIGSILAKIPGFGGYMERNVRREADQLLRTTIGGRLEESRLQLGNIYPNLSQDIILAMEYAEPLGRVDTVLAGLIGKIQAAPAGYSGWFDSIKIEQKELERIYAFDNQMMQHAEEIAADVASLGTAVQDRGEIGAAIRTLETTLQKANVAFKARQELLSGFAI